jgi:ribA/ribD-fused uncharacterized protein
MFHSKGQEDYVFLSNFHNVSIILKDKVWPSVEHCYQAMKTVCEKDQEKIRRASSVSQVKRLGNQIELRPDWDDIKVDVMKAIVKAKFVQNKQLSKRLIDTGDSELVEYAPWGDIFWGVNKEGVGENMLGKILMEIRGELL